MKTQERAKAVELRQQGYSINEISNLLGVAKSSVSIWVRDIQLTPDQFLELSGRPYTSEAVEKRRTARLKSESNKRDLLVGIAKKSIRKISAKDLLLIGTMLYWAEGGKTQRMVRFSNGDPRMIKIMMEYFRRVCEVPEEKFRGYIHIHPHLDHIAAEKYWSDIAGIPLTQFFKTYRKPNISSQGKKDTLPEGVMDIYVMDTALFHKITGWAEGIFCSY